MNKFEPDESKIRNKVRAKLHRSILTRRIPYAAMRKLAIAKSQDPADVTSNQTGKLNTGPSGTH